MRSSELETGLSSNDGPLGLSTPSGRRAGWTLIPWLGLSISSKEKEKADSHSSTVWGDQGLAVDRAHGVVTAEDLKVFDGVPFNVVANQQVHKLVQVIYPCVFGIYPSFTDDISFLFRC